VISLDPFYPIVPDTNWLVRLLPIGVKFLQLRLKAVTRETIAAEIGKAVALAGVHDCQLVVNDHWREAIQAGADFIHLGQEDLAAADLNAIRAAGLRLGISTHNEQELERALAAKPDYVALGPIYETKLKQMSFAPQGLARIAEWRSKIAAARLSCPLVAIGGITLERAPVALAAGTDSVAVITDIVTNADPELRARDWLAATAPWRNLSTGSPQG
jgi:thiamine-phosphate pyrophosphorylase